ncbi:tetratricopeptide repeat protein [Paenacidovorax monticola]|uniref:Tetratricopeptide repeat protein n=1 Tax=Paenacidovorax monticola TaxID=1926868 RepID=A0A7H0HF52_9BURK|nr:tetratricopeptide repeat protein [Paenacidovorax monticola]QNP59168.1 tetratricopeptide repeat protein [Paenacidovorax monticola]
MDYYGSMVHILRFRTLACVLALIAGSTTAWAQSPNPEPATDSAEAEEDPQTSEALNAELFYEVFLGELTNSAGDPGTGYALMLEAARRSNSSALYRRAADIALQARSGESALVAVRAWKSAQPQSREANRYLLQILVALNRIGETPDLLRQELAQTPARAKAASLQAIPALYGRASDKALAASVVEQALADELAHPALGPTARVTVGRMQLAAGDKKGALAAAQKAQALDAANDGAAMLALELAEEGMPEAQALITRYFAGQPAPELRMAYARSLLGQQRYPEASTQLDTLTREKPDLPEAWLVQATLQTQDNRLDAAEVSLDRFMALVEKQGGGEARKSGLTQAYLLHAQIAEKRQKYDEAERWLARIDNAEDLFGAQVRRASLLARQGRLAHARALIRSLPAKTPEDERMKLSAEVQLLRDAQQYKEAYALQAQVVAMEPDNNDLVYDQAMLAEKAGNPEAMEQLLRKIIARQPDYHHAYNALGYALADRGVHLAEAKRLIEKAMAHAPGDPFITDSLGWVEFRLGNRAEALRLLESAFEKRPDPEIAAHLGEVLWSMQQRDSALAIWRQGLRMSADNDILLNTLKRLGVQP